MDPDHLVDPALRPLSGPDRPPDPPRPSPAPEEEMVCPECGIDLRTIQVERHADLHWPDLAHLNNPTYDREHALARVLREKLLAGGVTRDTHSRLKTTGRLEE